MNILFITHFFAGFMVYEIPRVSVFGYCAYSVTFPYWYFRKLYICGNMILLTNIIIYIYIYIYIYINNNL